VLTPAICEKVLLFHSEKGKTLELSSLDVLSGAPSAPPERGILLVDLRSQGRDDIIISNGNAGTLTLLLSK
jgi:hypothetical protein